ncbi:hypothetical protein QUF50_07765 [Thiotrichales bacterium HSG1]|nr:hypothetical protein [Thiotrichales bacterium HSG1]
MSKLYLYSSAQTVIAIKSPLYLDLSVLNVVVAITSSNNLFSLWDFGSGFGLFWNLQIFLNINMLYEITNVRN